MEESTLDKDVSLLIGKYGIVAVHKFIMNRMKDDYTYMKKLFNDKKEVKSVKPILEHIVENNMITNNVVVDEEEKNSVVKVDVEEEKEEKKEEKKKDSKFRDPKEMKEWQKQQEDKKREENKAKGIKPQDLLTKENLKKWIEDENRTYAYIAREYVGCKDIEVSAVAKKFGITKKNNIVRNIKIQMMKKN